MNDVALAEYQAYLEWRRDNDFTDDTADQVERVRAQLEDEDTT